MTTTENTTPQTENTETAPAGVDVVPQMELGALLDTALRKAVLAQIQAQAKETAEGVVAAMLTPQVRAGMRETAVLEAQVALDPALAETMAAAAQPEPVASDKKAKDEDDAEPEEEPPLEFESVEEFVEGYVVPLYRRAVYQQGETTYRWCPRWWAHGEVHTRLSAVHRAFETLRHGKGVEPSLFWLAHLDPHMSVILDPEGPFKYCSMRNGHSTELGPLPVVSALEGTVTSGYYELPSGLAVPVSTRPPARRRVEFP